MTVLDERHLVDWSTAWAPRSVTSRTATSHGPVVRRRPQRPVPNRPALAALPCRGNGVAMSYAPHTRRPVSTVVTVALAGLAALITLWLGSLAQFSAQPSAAPAPVSTPGGLVVVEVHAGETLEEVAVRLAPEAPVGLMVERIRDLNKLDSATVDAGRTLIAPVG